MNGIHEVLFRLVGDEDDAREALEEIASELQAFSRIHAEAEAELEISEAQKRIKELRAQLVELSNTTSRPEIETDVAGVVAQIEALQTELDRLDREEVSIDVDVQRGVAERLASIASQTGLLTRATQIASDEQKSFAARILDSTVNIGPFTTQVRVLGPLLLALSSVIGSLIAAIGALVSSLAFAVGGLAALAVAFGGALVPAIGLGIAAIARFKDQADIAGTAANDLKRAFSGFGDAVAPIVRSADPALRGIADAVRSVLPLVRSLGDEFRTFSQSAGSAARFVGDAVAKLRQPIAQLVESAGPVFQQLARIAVRFGEVLLNIANAAMPFLISGLKDVAGAMKGWAVGTRNSAALTGTIAILIDHLASWLELAKQVSRIMLNFFAAAAPAGKEFVDWLAKGAEGLADWLGSAEGVARVRDFMEDLLPVARQTIEFIGRLVVVFLQLAQIAGPVVGPIIDGMNQVLAVVQKVLSAIQDFVNLVQNVTGFDILGTAGKLAFTGMIGPIKAVIDLVKTLPDLLGGIPGLFGDVTSAVGDAAGAVGDFFSGDDVPEQPFRGLIDNVVNSLTGMKARVHAAFRAAFDPATTHQTLGGFFRAVGNEITVAFGGVTDKMRAAARRLISVMRTQLGDLLDWSKDAGAKHGGAVADGVNSKQGDVQNAGRRAADAGRRGALSVVPGWLDAGRRSGQAVGQGVQSGGASIATIARGLVARGIAAVLGLAGAFRSAGLSIAQNLASGIASGAGAVVGAISGLLAKARAQAPGSEPKDPRSPMRGLGKSGEAIVDNIAAGVRLRRGELAKAMREALAPGAPNLGRMPQLASASGSPPIYNQEFHVHTIGGGSADPRMAAAQLALLERQRGGA